jgi:hypothetical protein
MPHKESIIPIGDSVSIQIHSIKIWTFGHDKHATRKVTFLQRHHKKLYHFPKKL